MKTFNIFLISLFISQLSLAQVDCVDETLINPDIFCTADWNPVCGCDGVTYSNACAAVNYGGVTSYTSGECGTLLCEDLSDIDFGLCDMVLGYAFAGGSCTLLSGCGWVVDNIDYSPYFFENENACFMACSGEMDCLDLDGLDFGDCDFTLGIALVNSECLAVSGCYWTIGNTDYSPFFFQSLNDCQQSCGNSACFDLAFVDFGTCTMPLGVAFVNGECTSLSGCDWTVDGVDYSPYFFESLASCQTSCEENSCLDLSAIDFGDCELFLGFAIVNESCQAMSGCGWTANEIDYSPYFYDSYEECVGSCQSCINTLLINLEFPIAPDTEPVCGCDNVTYFNADVAYYHYGVTAYTPGECTTGLGVVQPATKILVSPNPTDGMVVITLNSAESTIYRLYSIDGTIVRTGYTTGVKTSVDLTSLASGIYFLEAAGKRTKIVR